MAQTARDSNACPILAIAGLRALVAGSSLAVFACPAVAAATAEFTDAEVRADQQFATYAYAHEFGSGVYDFNGRTLQVYTLPFAWWARHADARGPGLHLRLPVTIGFLDFRASDVVSTGLPDSVDSLSFVPGVELEFHPSSGWTLLPYVQAGASMADETDVETSLFGAGVRAEHSFPMDAYAGTYAGTIAYSGVRYRGDLPNDDFVRWRNAVELRRGTRWNTAGRNVEVGGFAVVDAYVDPPTGPATGKVAPAVQLEVGFVLGLQPMPETWNVPWPRLGLSYRYAGDLSGVRFVIGAPF